MSTNYVFVAGDIHGTHDIGKLRHLRDECRYGKLELTKDDYVIICGDFGLLWNNQYLKDYYGEESYSIPSNPKDDMWSYEELQLLKWYDECPWTTLFVDG
jgi:hypothetical protein